MFFPNVLTAETQVKRVSFSFYGHPVQYDFSTSFIKPWLNTSSEANVTNTLAAFERAIELDSLHAQMKRTCEALMLDDMAYLQLIKHFNRNVFKQEQTNVQQLILFTLLKKRHIDLILGWSSLGLTVYARTNFLIDNCVFIQRGNKLFYDLSFNQNKAIAEEKELATHIIQHPVPLVMNPIAPPLLNAKSGKKVIPFEHDGFVYFFTVKTNESLVEYYRDLPTISINTVYLNYGLSPSIKQSLVTELKKAVRDMRTEYAIDFILKFTQRSFEYRKDELVYGQEKFSFPEETIVNNYADCEDKAMLFASLVSEVLGLKTIALYYKNAQHINVAIQSWNNHIPTSITFQDKGYIICEPTIKGYTLGENSVNSDWANLIDW